MSKDQWTQRKKDLIRSRMELHNDLDDFGRVWDREDLEMSVLYDQQYVDIHLLSGEILVARLLEMGPYMYFVEVAQNETVKKLLVPKHSVKFVLLRDQKTEG